MNQTQRLHPLDNLRAVMMWLGIVLHIAVIHLVKKSPIILWQDQEKSRVADFLVGFIHAFRMPVFFILSGFFVAMLVSRHGYGGMLKHRLRRIGLPFIIFWPPIFAGSVVLILASKWWGFLVLAAPLAVTGAFYDDGIVIPDGSFMPNWGSSCTTAGFLRSAGICGGISRVCSTFT